MQEFEITLETAPEKTELVLIPEQTKLDIRSRKKIIVCEYCGRILIDKYICDYDGSQQKADLEALLDSQKKKGRRLRKSEE